MAFTTMLVTQDFPVEGCKRRVAMRTARRISLLHIHVRDTVVVLKEVNLHHSR